MEIHDVPTFASVNHAWAAGFLNRAAMPTQLFTHSIILPIVCSPNTFYFIASFASLLKHHGVCSPLSLEAGLEHG